MNLRQDMKRIIIKLPRRRNYSQISHYYSKNLKPYAGLDQTPVSLIQITAPQ
jgi:hypothetical protein